MRPLRIEFYKDKRKEWRWRVKAANGKILGDSGEGYKRLASCRRGWQLVRWCTFYDYIVVEGERL